MDFYSELDRVYANGEDVEAYLNDFASTLESEGQGSTDQYVMCVNELGSFLRGRSRYEESIGAFMKAVNVLKGRGEVASENYATTLNNMATAYRMMGDNETAKEFYFESLETYDSLPGGFDGYLYAGVLNNISGLYLSEGDFVQAKEYLNRAINILEKHPEYVDEIATSKTNLSSLYIQTEEFDKAEKTVTEAIALFEKLPYESGHYAMALNNQAVLKVKSEDYQGAIDIWEVVLVKIKEIFSENADYAYTSRNLATLYAKIGKYNEAEVKLKKVVEIFNTIFPEGNENTLRAMKELEEIEARGEQNG